MLLAAVLALAPQAEPGPAAGLRQVTECAAPGVTAGPEDGGGLATVLGPALERAHALARGAGQLVAVIDTGVSPSSRLPNLRGGGDFLTGGDGLDDCDGHGTAVAGLLGAAPDRDDDVVGIAPDATIVAIRQLSPSFTVRDGSGSRPAGDTDTLAAAILRAVELHASVVTVSEAVCLEPVRAAAVGRSLREALRRAAAADVLVVAAAGNAGSGDCTGRGDEVSLPGGAAWVTGTPGDGHLDHGVLDDGVLGDGVLGDGVLTVGAVLPDDTPAPFTVPGPWVDVAAQGTGLRSLGIGSGLTAAELQGTSFAVPLVAGLAALVRERNPELGAAAVAQRLADTARRPAGDRTEAIGHGVVDPIAALSALPVVAPPSAGSVSQPAPEPAPDPSTTGIGIAAGTALVLLCALVPLVGRLRRVTGAAAATGRAGRPPRPAPPRGPVPGRRAAGAVPPPGRRARL
ncbi:MAG: type VII secretion-associated serine protease mycosin [Pseudonocardia sp.]|nr:type VII secretion-associated serine protease mycosin [Pseudonocardia sp.]